MERIKRIVIVFLFSMILYPNGNCSGEEISTDFIAGTEVSSKDQVFGYIGVGLTKPVKENLSIVGRVFSGYLKYTFESDSKKLAAEISMVIPSVGIRLKKDDITLTGSAGLDLKRSEKETISGDKDVDNNVGIFIQGEVDVWGKGLKNLGIIASYSSIDNFFWGRVRAKKGILKLGGHKNLLIGAEFVGMGNNNFNATQAGGVLELLNTSSSLSFLLKGGYKHTSDISDSGYGGVELYYRF